MIIEEFQMTASVNKKLSVTQADSKTNSKIRAGIVGAGLMGYWHAHALEKAGGEVVGFADFDVAKAEKLAAKYPKAKVFGDIEKMLATQKFDVLHVCSPTESHETIAETAVKAGVHLLIEKPLATTANETIRLYDLAARNKTVLCPVHQFAFQDGATKAEKQLKKIGRLVHLEATVCSAGGARSSIEQLDQIAADILPHPLSLMQKFLEDDFSETEWNVLRPTFGEWRVTGKAREKSLSIFISMNSRPTNNSFHLFGTNGAIHLDLFHGFSVVESGKTSRATKVLHPFDLAWRNFSAASANLASRVIRREPAYPGLRRLIQEFYSGIKSDSKSPISPSDAIAVAEIRDKLINLAFN